MKAILHTILLSLFCFLFSTSCVKKAQEQPDTAPVVVHEDNNAPRNDISNVPAKPEPPREAPRKTSIKNIQDVSQLKKYSVVAATLTQPNGIAALKDFFDRDGIDYAVVRNPSGSYYFVIATSDSEEEAVKARGVFLLQSTVDKSREDIWQRYYIQLTDAFIMER